MPKDFNRNKSISLTLVKKTVNIARSRTGLTFRVAASERVAGEWRGTAADGVVVDDGALSCESTSAGTGVCTALVDTSLVHSTLRADHTLRTTRGWRTDEPGQARAHCLVVHFTTLTVGSTGRRDARLRHHWRCNTNYV